MIKYRNYFIKVSKKLASTHLRILSKWWLFIAKMQAILNNGEFNIDSTLKLNCPIRCDGTGIVTIHENVKLGYSKAPRYGNGEILLQARKKSAILDIGTGTATSNNVMLIANEAIKIGKNCLIGELVSVYDSDFHDIDIDKRRQSRGEVAAVLIGDNVWLGSRVMVMKGVTIGNNSVIAAGSIVTKPIPENVLAAGIPATTIRKINV